MAPPLVITNDLNLSARELTALSVEVTVTGGSGFVQGTVLPTAPPGFALDGGGIGGDPVLLVWQYPVPGIWSVTVRISDDFDPLNFDEATFTITVRHAPVSSIITEAMGVKQFLGDPLDQSPSIRQIVLELETEYLQMTNQVNNRGLAQHVGEYLLTTSQDVNRYVLDIPAGDFYKALSVVTVPEEATVTGGEYDQRTTVTGGDDRELGLEFFDLEHGSYEWAYLAKNRGQVLSSSHDSQLIAFYKTLITGEGEKVVVELRPTPSGEQRYKILYQITDWWDRVFENPSNGVTDVEFKLPHSSQRMMIRALVGMNLIQKGVVRWALNDEYNMKRGQVVYNGLKDRFARYKETYEDYIDTLDHHDVVFIELFGDRL